MQCQTIPITRIFDQEKAKAFYVEYLGMQIDWEHRFGDDFPVYMQVSKGDLVLHLSEHSGDCTPGSKVFVNVKDIDALFAELDAKDYTFCKPQIEDAPWGDRCLTVVDPFSNRILFNQPA